MKRTHKTIKTRRAMNRSGKQLCLICKEKHILVTHHILGRDIPNCNCPSNLCSVCPNCHDLIHWGKVIIECWARTSNGLELFWHKEGEESFTGQNAKPPLIEQ